MQLPRYSLDELRVALRFAAGLLGRHPGDVDDGDFDTALVVLSHFAPVPDFEARYCWLAGCHLTDDERRSTRRLAIEIAARRGTAPV